MPRNLSMVQAIKAGHRFAEQHVARHAAPDEAAFDAEWDAYMKRNESKLTLLDLQIIWGYASAALRYTGRLKSEWFEANDKHKTILWRRAGYEKTDPNGGMWSRQRGNIDTAQESAA